MGRYGKRCWGEYETGHPTCSRCSLHDECRDDTFEKLRKKRSVTVSREGEEDEEEREEYASDDPYDDYPDADPPYLSGRSKHRKIKRGEKPAVRLAKNIVMGVGRQTAREVVSWIDDLEW